MALRKMTTFVPNMFASKSQQQLNNENGPGMAAKKAGLAALPTKSRAALGDIGNVVPDDKAGKKDAKDVKVVKKTGFAVSGRAPLHSEDEVSKATEELVKTAVAAVAAAAKPAEAAAAPATTTTTTQAAAAPIAKQPEEMPANVFDIDAEDEENPQLVSEYVKEIYSYMLDLEVRHAVPNDYLASQKDLTPQMRSVLVDWLASVHLRFKFLQETMFMTIDVLDRFLAIQHIPRSKLQLAGVTALLIAAKYEEMYPPIVSDLIYITDQAYSRAEILAMESLMLRKLDYNLGTPLPLHFLRRYSKACGADAMTHTLAKYLLELKMGDYSMVSTAPSITAAGATLLSRRILLNEGWNAQLEYYSGYKESDLGECVENLSRLLATAKTSEHQTIYKKFSNIKLQRISVLPEVEAFAERFTSKSTSA